MGNESYFGRIIGFEKNHIRDFKANIGIHEELHYGRPIYQMIVNHTRKKEYPEFFILKDNGIEHYTDKKLKKFNTILNRKLISIAPNGAVFLNQPKSVTAILLKKTYMERVKQKGLKAKFKNKAREFEKNSDEFNHYMELSNEKHALQWAIKILINSFFGVTGVPYCRYCNVNIAEAITSCGRHTIQQSEIFVNELFNNPEKSKNGQKLLKIIKKEFKNED
jgi:DNA polymerase elongation subunit (family B)